MFRSCWRPVAFAMGMIVSTPLAHAEPRVQDPLADNLSERELKAASVSSLSSSRALVRQDSESNEYKIHLRFVVARGCAQTYFHVATPEELPKLFPRIKAFKVRRVLDDGFLVDAEEGFIGIPLTYPVRVKLDEDNAQKRTVRIFSLDDDIALAPTDTVEVVAALTEIGHPHFCHVDFRAKTTLPIFVPDAAVDLALGYSEDEIAFAIREALNANPRWAPERKVRLLTASGRSDAAEAAQRRAVDARARANAANARAKILRQQADEAAAKANALTTKSE